MKAVKVLGKFFAFLFTALFGVLFTLFIAVLFVRNIISYEVIDSSIRDFDILSVTSKEVSYNEDKTIREQISEELLGMNIPLEVINGFFDSDEVYDIISDYSYNYINYVLFGGSKPILSENKMVVLFEEQFNLYGYDFNEKRVEIETYISLTCGELNDSIPSAIDLDNMGYDTVVIRKGADMIFSNELMISLVFSLILVYIFISICLWSKSRTLRYITVPIILEGIIILVFNMSEVKIMERFLNSQGIIDSLILSIFSNGFNKFFALGIALIVIGLLLFVVSFVLLRKSKKKSKELLDNVIMEEVVKSGAKYDLRDHVATSDEDIDKIDNTITNLKIKEENVVKEKLKVKIKDKSDSKIECNEKVIVTENGEIDKIEITSNTKVEEVPSVEPYVIDEPVSKVDENMVSSDLLPVATNEVRELEVVDKQENLPIENSGFDMEIVEVDNDEVPVSNHDDVSDNTDEIVIENVSDEEDSDDIAEEEVSDTEFVEMDEENLDEIVVNKDLEVIVPNSIEVEIVSPKKGNDIKVDLSASEEPEEEEIEFL